MSRPGIVFSRDQLLDAVWGHGRAVTARTVDVYILRLRQKIESGTDAADFIQSARGFGYSFSQPDETAGPAPG
jgi:DNA-binding response OmpR family regulator